MRAKHWMQIAALASALGLSGAAAAVDTGGATGADKSGASTVDMDAPSAGAIVTPEDKAVGMGKIDSGERQDRNGETSTSNHDRANDSASMPADNESAPARTGSNVEPGDMGPGSVRGQ